MLMRDLDQIELPEETGQRRRTMPPLTAFLTRVTGNAPVRLETEYDLAQTLALAARLREAIECHALPYVGGFDGKHAQTLLTQATDLLVAAERSLAAAVHHREAANRRQAAIAREEMNAPLDGCDDDEPLTTEEVKNLKVAEHAIELLVEGTRLPRSGHVKPVSSDRTATSERRP